MAANRLEDRGNLLLRESNAEKNRGRLFDCIADVVPTRQGARFFGTVPDEDPEVMQPGGGVDHIIVVDLALADQAGQPIETWLVSELIDRPGLTADIFG
jgi:hypothetical protein